VGMRCWTLYVERWDGGLKGGEESFGFNEGECMVVVVLAFCLEVS
jgi:hypothetical protein